MLGNAACWKAGYECTYRTTAFFLMTRRGIVSDPNGMLLSILCRPVIHDICIRSADGDIINLSALHGGLNPLKVIRPSACICTCNISAHSGAQTLSAPECVCFSISLLLVASSNRNTHVACLLLDVLESSTSDTIKHQEKKHQQWPFPKITDFIINLGIHRRYAL
jgi:hypothetical protein